MSNITYLLGAGASAKSLPVVEQMNSQIFNFLRIFVNHQIINDEKWNDPEIIELKESFLKLMEEAKTHASIDTYAKKLFLKNENDKLKQMKSLISRYLIYEQTLIEDKKLKSEGNGRLDDRYDPFFAALLRNHKDKLILPERVKIISWNYDYQLELAYCDFMQCTLEQSRDYLNIYPKRTYNETDKEYNIIKLNGTADMYELIPEKAGKRGYGSTNIAVEDVSFPAIHQAFKLAFSHCYSHNAHFNSSISFAWELNKENNLKSQVSFAKEIISNTTTLIVIGYSFPLFNREIDRTILSDNKLDNLYYQCTENHKEAINYRIRNTIQNSPNPTFINDLDQFHIPYEL